MIILSKFRIAIALVALGSSATAFVACSSDSPADSGPTAQHDSGTPSSPDASTTDSGASTPDDSGLPPIDASLPDVGNCTSDASTCNSCYTPQQDPVNGCSPASVNCVKFDGTRVPANAP